MQLLPQFQSDDVPFQLMQNAWATAINPILTNPVSVGAVLKNVPLIVGANVINHKLGRKLQGWYITRKRTQAGVYDTQDTNGMPDLTLQLVSDAVVTVDLYVF